MLHFPSVQPVLEDKASAPETFDKVAEKYCQVISRLRQEFEDRFFFFFTLISLSHVCHSFPILSLTWT